MALKTPICLQRAFLSLLPPGAQQPALVSRRKGHVWVLWATRGSLATRLLGLFGLWKVRVPLPQPNSRISKWRTRVRTRLVDLNKFFIAIKYKTKSGQLVCLIARHLDLLGISHCPFKGPKSKIVDLWQWDLNSTSWASGHGKASISPYSPPPLCIGPVKN